MRSVSDHCCEVKQRRARLVAGWVTQALEQGRLGSCAHAGYHQYYTEIHSSYFPREIKFHNYTERHTGTLQLQKIRYFILINIDFFYFDVLFYRLGTLLFWSIIDQLI